MSATAAQPPNDPTTSAHIDSILRKAGVLRDARVREVAVEPVSTTVPSRIQRLRLAYDGSAEDAPQTLILKTVHPERAERFGFAGRSEVAFYNEVAPTVRERALLRCYDAQYDEASNLWHLLLEDVSQSHFVATVWPVPPTTVQCEQVVAAYARFHAALWDDPRLGTAIGHWQDAAEIDAELAAFATKLGRFADRLGDPFPDERRALFERLLAAIPWLLQPYHRHRHATVVHGDSHVWNCFLPRNADGRPLLFDWIAGGSTRARSISPT